MKVRHVIRQLSRVAICVALFGALCSIGSSALAADRSASHRVSGEIVEYAISPNGQRVAEIFAFGKGARQQKVLIVQNLLRDKNQRVIKLSGGAIEQFRWENNRDLLTVQSGIHGSIVIQEALSGKATVLLRFNHQISIAAYDRRRGLVAYEYSTPWRWRGRQSVRVKGYMNTLELLAPPWARWPGWVHVGAFRILGSALLVHARRLKIQATEFHSVPELAWKHGNLLALVSGLSSWRAKLVNLKTGETLGTRSGLFRMTDLTVSSRGQIAAVSYRIHLGQRKSKSCGCNGSLNIFELNNSGPAKLLSAFSRGRFIQDVSRLWWAPQGKIIAQVMGHRRHGGAPRWFLEEVDGRTGHLIRRLYWPGGDLGGNTHVCSFDASRTIGICVVQSLTHPPEMAVVYLRTDTIKILRRVNALQRTLKVHFVKVKVRSCFGRMSTGFLAIPRVAKAHAVPLAVMSYGFTEAYSKNAQWIRSYPVDKFVRSGIAVLLINWARVSSVRHGSFGESKRALESAISLYADAIPAVERKGVRVSRAIAMGWSFGGLFVAHVIQRLPMYVAAQVGDPADYNVTEFGLGGDYWANQSRVIFGGPPAGRYLSRYKYFDPVGSDRPALGPVLLEFVSRNPDVGQLLQEWRAVGSQVEAFAYRKSVHWLNVPAEARISRTRNLYWALLNLLGPTAVTKGELKSVGLSMPRDGWWMRKPGSDYGFNEKEKIRRTATNGPMLQRRRLSTVGTAHQK